MNYKIISTITLVLVAALGVGVLVGGNGSMGATNGLEVIGPGPAQLMHLSQDGLLTTSSMNVTGNATVDVLTIDGGADLAEPFVVNGEKEIKPGMVVCIDPVNPGTLTVCTSAYAKTVVGAISGAGGFKSGMIMGQSGSIADGEHPVALSGRIYIYADANYGAIQPGDLLTTSDTPGHAMKVSDSARAQGAILGKAMTPLESGTDLILVLLTLQ